MENKKRNVLITGGTGKIGEILIEKMLTDGHRVVFTSTSIQKAELLIKKLDKFKHTLDFFILKFGDDDGIWIDNLPWRVDAVIHNARSLNTLSIQDDGFSDGEDITNEFKYAVVFPYLMTKELINKAHPLRDVLFITSMYGTVAPNKNLYDDFHHQSPIQYGIAKSAQVHLAKELAVRFAEKLIRVNAISYGGIEGRATEEFIQKYAKLCPAGRMLNENDLYPSIQLFLNNYDLIMTGENIKVDGGWTIW